MMFWTSTNPTARKPHVCELCERSISPGEVYRRGVGIGDGTVWTWKECAHCEAVLRIYPDIYWDDTYCRDSLIEWEPRTFLGQLRKARFLQSWRHGNGEMASVPTEEQL